MSFKDDIKDLAEINIFEKGKDENLFVGRPYYLDFDKAHLLINDAWKHKVGGIPQGTFLLAFYENENDKVDECLLLRVIKPAKLPTDNEIISTMVDYYKNGLESSGKNRKLDDFTKYQLSFSGLECRILGTFYKNKKVDYFGADVENYYSAHNYKVYKPIGRILEKIVNFRDGHISIGSSSDFKIGKIRYSSSCRFQDTQEEVPVYVNPNDFLGKRTALFGMTRTGKSNTVKKIIETTSEISHKTNDICTNLSSTHNINAFKEDGIPNYKVGQIIFDMNGEYANANLQDDGTAIFQKYMNITKRYSTLEKKDFKPLRINFFTDITAGFELISSLLSNENSDYVKSFLSVNLEEPDKNDKSKYKRWQRKKAVYLCCLKKAGFIEPENFKVFFEGNQKINDKITPSIGIPLEQAITYWEDIVEKKDDDFFAEYKKNKGHDWIDEELKSLLVFLTRKRNLDGSSVSGFSKLAPFKIYHTNLADTSFEKDIVKELREGCIVIVDLSQGNPIAQKVFTNKLCLSIFEDAMDKFVKTCPNNFIQFYFEEAHNLFPKKDDKDLNSIYNRIAKEGAKLNIGLIYATQEVSSISSNILKNTQNWFIAHLNNDDEIREIKKFYDFVDFCDNLIKYSSGNDKGFIRMKTYSNAFIIPVQVDRFEIK